MCRVCSDEYWKYFLSEHELCIIERHLLVWALKFEPNYSIDTVEITTLQYAIIEFSYFSSGRSLSMSYSETNISQRVKSKKWWWRNQLTFHIIINFIHLNAGSTIQNGLLFSICNYIWNHVRLHRLISIFCSRVRGIRIKIHRQTFNWNLMYQLMMWLTYYLILLQSLVCRCYKDCQ